MPAGDAAITIPYRPRRPEVSATGTLLVVPDAPDGGELGAYLRDGLERAAGARLEAVPAAALPDAAWETHDLILVGNLLDNRAVGHLYARHHAFADASYPGGAGYDVRTVADPFGSGRGSFVVSGSTAAGHRRAADVFLSLVAERGARPGCLLAASSARTNAPTPTEADLGRLVSQGHAALLDAPAVGWVARHAAELGWTPRAEETYFDKLACRRDFDPQSEYLCLEGPSTYAHGHQDGNAITRLTWRDRVWLADLVYIRFHARHHNAVIVVRDGEDRGVPPLTSLDCLANLPGAGVAVSSVRGYNGATWRRRILWRPARFFLVLDEVEAELGFFYGPLVRAYGPAGPVQGIRVGRIVRGLEALAEAAWAMRRGGFEPTILTAAS